MSQLELKKTDLKVKLYGEEYMLRKPTVVEIESFGERAGAVDTDQKTANLMKELVVSLGMPKQVVDSMEFDHFIELCNYVTGVKKN